MNQQTLPHKQYHQGVACVFIQVHMCVFMCVCALSMMLGTSWQMEKQSFFLFGLVSNASSRLVLPFCACFFALSSAVPRVPRPGLMINHTIPQKCNFRCLLRQNITFIFHGCGCMPLYESYTAQRFTERERVRIASC